MRRMSWLLLVIAGCAGPDADPLDVAERFHALRLAGDDPGLHALLADDDRAAIPVQAFPSGLPPRLALELLGWGDARVDSASLAGVGGDSAAVVLHVAGAGVDTLRLLATHHPWRLWLFEKDRVRWRVSIGLAERMLLDSLATSLRIDATDPATAVERATSYLRAAEEHPRLARSADVDAARAILRKAEVAAALRIDLRVAESFTGTRLVAGSVDNPTGRRVATLRLVVRDQAGNEERVELWDIAPGGATPVSQLSRLRTGPLTHRLERIQVF